MTIRADNSKEEKSTAGGMWQLWQYMILAIAAAIVAIVSLLGYITYSAIQGNLIAGAILLTLLVLLVGMAFSFIVWATMWVNQRQDERAGAQMIKVMQYSQLAQGQDWQQKFQVLAAGYNVAQAKAKADIQQLKVHELETKQPQLAPVGKSDEGDYLEIDGLEVSL